MADMSMKHLQHVGKPIRVMAMFGFVWEHHHIIVGMRIDYVLLSAYIVCCIIDMHGCHGVELIIQNLNTIVLVISEDVVLRFEVEIE